MGSGRSVKCPRHHSVSAIGFDILRAIEFTAFPQVIMYIALPLNARPTVTVFIVNQIQIQIAVV